MTTHLSPREFVEAAEGTLVQGRVKHLDACEACRREASELSSLMDEVRGTAAMPEPSPLFWDHLSQRVQAATMAEPVPTRSWWHGAWRPIATLAAVAAMVLLMVELRLPRAAGGPDSGTAANAPAVSGEGADLASTLLAAQPAEDDAMNFVTELAADVSWDDLQLVAQPSRDVTAAAVEQLTPAQRAELARLVKAAMDGAE